MEAQMRELNFRKGQLKARTTRLESYINKLSDHVNTVDLKSRLTIFEKTIAEFEDVQSKLEFLQPNSSDHESERESFEKKYFDLIIKIKDLIKKHEVVEPTVSPLSQQPTALVNVPVDAIAATRIKLPVIDIPRFSGGYTDWLPFYDAFSSLIHDNLSLNDIQRFQYLRSSLQGEAAKLIDYITVSAENYSLAWSRICERFNNTRMLVQSHINILLNLPVVSNGSLNALRNLTDNFNGSFESLKRLNIAVDSWDAILIPIVTLKFDYATRKEWEGSLKTTEIPTVQELKEFLMHRCRFLENMHLNKNSELASTKPHKSSIKSVNISLNAQKCPVCQAQHFIYTCPSFQELSCSQRFEKIKGLNLCTNCLREGHRASQCRSGGCKHCQRKHHTLLHMMQTHATEKRDEKEAPQTVASAVQQSSKQVLLSTFVVNVYDVDNKPHECRGLLDVGSQCDFISQRMFRLLRLKPRSVNVPISGINQSHSTITQSVIVHFKSRFCNFSSTVNCFVVPKITENLPFATISKHNIHIPAKIQLSDPQFFVSNPIDLLLGAENFWNLLCVGQIQISNDQPRFQKTLLGWIAGGVVGNRVNSNSNVCAHSMQLLEQQVSRFWTVEEPNKDSLSPQDEECERHFISTMTRTKEGRFCVQLPFKLSAPTLGFSQDLAIKRFYALERKLNRDSNTKQQYTAFIHEYLALGHMEPVPCDELHQPNQVFYLPHHCVIRNDSLTTKLRVVFDGSFKSSNNVSLNDTLASGPVLQQELFLILLRFRFHRYILCADIKQMYRQVSLSPCHRDFHRIVWRDKSNESLQHYRLTTVTYGITSAPYLAIRCLQELATTDGKHYPKAQNVILHDFYVDDMLTGFETVEEGIEVTKRVIEVLANGGFILHKWASNNLSLLSAVNPTIATSDINLDKQEKKTLGIWWNSNLDTLVYHIEKRVVYAKVTKRVILSTISQFFDPLGLIAPVFVFAKILLQKLWSLKLSWDEAIPQKLHHSWLSFSENLVELNALNIPRKTIEFGFNRSVELHAFCDASENAYGTCIYVKTIDDEGKSFVKLLCAKSRIAPIKSLTLPRLELCGAVLLSRLLHKVKTNIPVACDKMYCWTDSTIVLSWIANEAHTWKTFVGNRVSEIQSLTKIAEWRHVPTSDNPADLISRGLLPQQIKNSNLWWNGPSWLLQPTDCYPSGSAIIPDDFALSERRRACFVATSVQKHEFLSKFSKFITLQRVIAYCFRFSHNLRHPTNKFTSYLSISELNEAFGVIVRLVQREEFSSDILCLSRGKLVDTNSKLRSLNPYLDPEGILRVGGRLEQADVAINVKHPIMLPAKHHVTKLIIRAEHARLLHAGIQSTLASLRLRFWIIDGRNSVRGVLRSCMQCFRVKPTPMTQMMGELPASRLKPSRPFTKCGLDYGGPILIKEGRGRGRRTLKSYIVLFVCLVTKAIHIELVCDCTSETFLNALKRFMSRRGKPREIYSDNGTTFVGANNELRALQDLITSKQFEVGVVDRLLSDGIHWHFIPPNAPHFGGLWEAGIKATKTHLKRVVGNALLTYEEMYGVLVQVEGCLNSRPLTALSNDPNDPTALTPGHFLIGSSLNSPPEQDISSVNENRLSRWERSQQIVQHFWARWSKEYLTLLHQRTKWKNPTGYQSLIGKLALIRDDHLPPLCWKLARIMEVHPGKDKLIRVVTLKTNTGNIKRPVTKVCLLPANDGECMQENIITKP